MPAPQKAVPAEETIRLHAYHLWEQDGRPHGRDLEFWQRAAAALAAVMPSRPAGAAKTAAPAAKPKAVAKPKAAAGKSAPAATKGKARG